VDLLLKRDALRLVELLATEGGLDGLAAGLGCFIETPRLWDPEAEGFRILADVTHRSESSTERAEIYLETLGLRHRRLESENCIRMLEVYRPRSAHPG